MAPRGKKGHRSARRDTAVCLMLLACCFLLAQFFTPLPLPSQTHRQRLKALLGPSAAAVSAEAVRHSAVLDAAFAAPLPTLASQLSQRNVVLLRVQKTAGTAASLWLSELCRLSVPGCGRLRREHMP